MKNPNIIKKRKIPAGRISILIILALLVQVFLPQNAVACAPDIDVIPASLDFGQVAVGTLSSPQTITLTNNGTCTLYICDIEMTGPDATMFGITSLSTTDNKIPPGESASGTVRFLPGSTGTKTATLRICSNDPDETWVEILLSGEASRRTWS
jgi:hypothetical protein